MSTKIYTGFCMDCPIDQAVPFLQKCREDMTPQVKELFKDAQCRAIMQLAARIAIDGDTRQIISEGMYPKLISSKSKDSLDRVMDKPLHWANWFVERWEQQNETTEIRIEIEPDYHFELNLCLYPFEGKTYGVAFGADRIIQLFLDLPQIHDFHYQNQTDQPENISDEEWKERERVWDSVLGNRTFAENALQYRLFDRNTLFGFPYLKKEDVTQYLEKHRKEEIERYVRNVLTFRIMEESLKKEGAREVSLYLEAARAACEEMKTGSARVEGIRTEISTKFPRTYEDCFEIIINIKN